MTNIYGGRANALTAKKDATFEEMGLTAEDLYIIFEVGNYLLSWTPGRTINPLLGITKDNGYWFVAKRDLDLREYFSPPTFDVQFTDEMFASLTALTSLIPPGLNANGSYLVSISPLRFGCVGDGVANDTAGFQLFINYLNATGRPGQVPPGRYLMLAPLLMKSNVTITWDDGAVMVRGFASPSSNDTAMFSQQINTDSFGVLTMPPLQNIKLNNLIYDMNDSTCTGRVATLYCHNLEINNLRVLRFSLAICLLLAGDYMRIGGPIIRNPTGVPGEGGIRFCGGKNFMCWNADVESGDDCFQFDAVANPTDPLFDLSIENGTYINCKGKSYGARLFVCGLEENNRATVKDIYFINVTGASGDENAVGSYLTDQSFAAVGVTSIVRSSNVSTMTVAAKTNRNFAYFRPGDLVTVVGALDTSFNGEFTILSVDVTKLVYTFSNVGPAATVNNAGILANNKDTSRISGVTVLSGYVDVIASNFSNAVAVDGVKDLLFDNFQIKNQKLRAFYITKGSKNVRILNFRNTKSRVGGVDALPVIEIKDSEQIFIGGGSKLIANGSDAILVGGGTSYGKEIRVVDVEIYDIDNGMYGVNFNRVEGGRVAFNKFIRSTGATDSRGVRVSNLCTKHRVVNNDFNNVDFGLVDAAPDITINRDNTPQSVFNVNATMDITGDLKVESLIDGYTFMFNKKMFAIATNIFNIATGNVGIGIAAPLFPLHVYRATGYTNKFEAAAGNVSFNLKTANGEWQVFVNGTSGVFSINDVSTGTAIGRIFINKSGIISFTALQDHVDNAAAKAAGLVDGQMYRTGDVVKQVHS